MKIKKVLLLGSDGFVGKYFSSYLKSKGIEVIEFDIKKGSDQDARRAKLPLRGVDLVLFLAWDVGGSKYLYKKDTQINQMEWNVKLMHNVFTQIKENKAKVLFTSSQLAEEIDTVYGVAKKLGEVWTKILGGSIVRFWNIYGPVEKDSQRSHVVSDLVNQAVENREIKLITDGQEKRQFIHIEDACRGILAALEAESGKVYDITTYEWVKVIDLANIIAAETNATITVGEKIGNTPITPHVDKIPGWKTETSLVQGIKKMIKEKNGK